MRVVNCLIHLAYLLSRPTTSRSIWLMLTVRTLIKLRGNAPGPFRVRLLNYTCLVCRSGYSVTLAQVGMPVQAVNDYRLLLAARGVSIALRHRSPTRLTVIRADRSLPKTPACWPTTLITWRYATDRLAFVNKAFYRASPVCWFWLSAEQIIASSPVYDLFRHTACYSIDISLINTLFGCCILSPF